MTGLTVLRVLVAFNAVATALAAVVLCLSPGAIPNAVGIPLESSQNFLVYLLASGELAIAWLCALSLRGADPRRLAETAGVLIVLHAASGVAGVVAVVQGADATILLNVALRVVLVLALAYLLARTAAVSRLG